MGREKAREGDHHLTWYLTRDEKYTVHSTSVFSSLRSLATIGPQRNISIDDNGTRHASVKKTNETVRDPRSVNYSVNFTVEQLIDPGKGSVFLVVPLGYTGGGGSKVWQRSGGRICSRDSLHSDLNEREILFFRDRIFNARESRKFMPDSHESLFVFSLDLLVKMRETEFVV